MSRDTLIVFRCDKPEVITAFNDAREADRRWGNRINRWARKAMPGKGRSAIVDSFRQRVQGLSRITYTEEPPEGWRVHRARGNGLEFFVPKVSTKAGKAAQAEIDALNKVAVDVRASVPGMPRYAGIFSSPGYELREDGAVLYCLWGTEPNAELIATDLWERIPLSRYYAVVEAETEAEDAPADDEAVAS